MNFTQTAIKNGSPLENKILAEVQNNHLFNYVCLFCSYFDIFQLLKIKIKQVKQFKRKGFSHLKYPMFKYAYLAKDEGGTLGSRARTNEK